MSKTINDGDLRKFYSGDISIDRRVLAKRGIVGDMVCGIVLLLVIALLATGIISWLELFMIVLLFGGPALIVAELRG